MKTYWIKQGCRYDVSDVYKLGEYKVGSAFYDSCTSKDDKLKYAATCLLPGINQRLGHFLTLAEAKQKVERAVDMWLRRVGAVE